MAVLTRKDFFNMLHERIGTDTTEESVKFLEDMTDTYNELEKRATSDGATWEEKYKALDEAWRTRYQHRFFNSDGGKPNQREPFNNGSNGITIDELFK